MSVVEKLLARIKNLFEPGAPAAPPQELDESPVPVVAVKEHAEPHRPEPIIRVPEPPPAEVAPVLAAPAPAAAPNEEPMVEPAALDEEAPTLIEEPPSAVEPIVPAAGALRLRLESERGAKPTFEVTKSGATIGRGPESTIQLADLSVSRKHAKITFKQGTYWLSDLGSMGGTWIDGTKLAAPRRVVEGQMIDIGLCRLSVISAGAEEEAPAAKRPSHAASGSSR